MRQTARDRVTEHDGHRIVVGIDGSESSRQALQWAIDEGRGHRSYVEAVHAWHDEYDEYGTPSDGDVLARQMYSDAADALVNDAVDAVDGTGLAAPIGRTVVQDTPAHGLLEAANDADLVVVGSRGRGGFSGLLVGSVSQQVLHHALCPVVVVPPTSDQ